MFLQDFLRRADENNDNELTFSEFVQYMTEHEKRLKIAFSDLDKNKDGM